MHIKTLLLLAAMSFLTISCNEEHVSVDKEVENQNQENIKEAYATLHPTQGNEVHGKVTFTLEKEGIRVVADVDGLKPGIHGFHIHEKGDCSALDGSSAGEHFNPSNSRHGGPEDSERHVGDLGNVVADDKGHAHYDRVDKMIRFSGENNIVGRSVVIHAGEDDFKSQPAGNSGARIACGLIEEKLPE